MGFAERKPLVYRVTILGILAAVFAIVVPGAEKSTLARSKAAAWCARAKVSRLLIFADCGEKYSRGRVSDAYGSRSQLRSD